MNIPHLPIALIALLLAWSLPTNAVILDDTHRAEVSLGDGRTVVLVGKDTGSANVKPTEFYYLPPSLHLAKNSDGSSQFLFLKFTGDDAGAPQGALLHFLMTYTLSEDDKRIIRRALNSQYPNSKIAGAVPLEIDEGGSFTIISGTVGEEAFIHTGRAPVVAGSRVAAATKLDAVQAQLLDKTFTDMAIGDVSVSAFYTYKTLSPGINASITMNWSEFHSRRQTLEAEYTKSRGRSGILGHHVNALVGGKKKKRSYTEVREDIEFLRDEGIIQIQIDQYQDNEVTKQVTEAVMQYVLNVTSQMAEADEDMPPAAAAEEDADPNIRYGHRYTYRESFLHQVQKAKNRNLVLTGRVPIRYPLTVTGNIGEWYKDVKDNRSNVDSINLNDPFFSIRPINFILDLDAEDIFSDAINFVTVNVRKKRSSGQDFTDHLTFDRKYFEENGVTRSTSYARGDDSNADVFDYQTVWSVRGGGTYPTNPKWEQGSWESVSLTPPVRARAVDVEADLAQMRTANISRATVQIRYPRLGKELQVNVPLSPAEGAVLKTERLITDIDAKGYAYRVVLNHRIEGKLVLDWTPKASDDYIYINIPDDFQNTDSPIFEEAKQAGDELVDLVEEKILERFDELLD